MLKIRGDKTKYKLLFLITILFTSIFFTFNNYNVKANTTENIMNLDYTDKGIFKRFIVETGLSYNENDKVLLIKQYNPHNENTYYFYKNFGEVLDHNFVWKDYFDTRYYDYQLTNLKNDKYLDIFFINCNLSFYCLTTKGDLTSMRLYSKDHNNTILYANFDFMGIDQTVFNDYDLNFNERIIQSPNVEKNFINKENIGIYPLIMSNGIDYITNINTNVEIDFYDMGDSVTEDKFLFTIPIGDYEYIFNNESNNFNLLLVPKNEINNITINLYSDFETSAKMREEDIPPIENNKDYSIYDLTNQASKIKAYHNKNGEVLQILSQVDITFDCQRKDTHYNINDEKGCIIDLYSQFGSDIKHNNIYFVYNGEILEIMNYTFEVENLANNYDLYADTLYIKELNTKYVIYFKAFIDDEEYNLKVVYTLQNYINYNYNDTPIDNIDRNIKDFFQNIKDKVDGIKFPTIKLPNLFDDLKLPKIFGLPNLDLTKILNVIFFILGLVLFIWIYNFLKPLLKIFSFLRSNKKNKKVKVRR